MLLPEGQNCVLSAIGSAGRVLSRHFIDLARAKNILFTVEWRLK
jgi:hypothetical protein